MIGAGWTLSGREWWIAGFNFALGTVFGARALFGKWPWR